MSGTNEGLKKKNVIEREEQDVEQDGCLRLSGAAGVLSVPVLDLSSMGSTLAESEAKGPRLVSAELSRLP